MRAHSPVDSQSQATDQKIRVMLVDDSAVVRGLMGRWLSAEDNIEVVARCHNGLAAVREVAVAQPSIIILDIEMPEMDGLEALPLLIAASPRSRILIASGLSTRNAEISMTALSKGAHDYIPKPSSNSGLTTSSDFRTELITKINALCVTVGGRQSSISQRTAPRDSKGTFDKATLRADASKMLGAHGSTEKSLKPLPKRAVSNKSASSSNVPNTRSRLTLKRGFAQEAGLVPFRNGHPDVLCIGSSTGGPKAIHQFLTGLGPALKNVPVLLTQHMPKSFTTVFAEHLDKALSVSVCEAEDGMEVLKGKVYVAPGDRHLMVINKDGKRIIRLDDGPEVNFCKPAVDVMFSSAVSVYRGKILSVILTGMGQDGVLGGQKIVEAGGNVIVQDEKSSIVWGMPGAAYKAGVCSAVVPLAEMSDKVSRIILEGRL